ncbi:MAG: hypothetical protein A2X49_11585 [Lentisphaerae bacterium GWF2_52_8]|nr:MAG: hypothetical protein A2X49_11585 [Lentisphaerae bacterium GWF2_52_8]
MKTKRNIIRIDKEKCNGCGLCVTACAEGALRIVDGKAQLLSETYCDGLGACIGRCPQDAISIEQREVEVFDEAAVKRHLASVPPSPVSNLPPHPAARHNGLCPGIRPLSLEVKPRPDLNADACSVSELSNWPVQLHLVPVNAPYWQDAELLIVADCVPFAYPDFHETLLRGRKLIIACPKLDDASGYVEKLSSIIAGNDIKNITVARMVVPCCGGIVHMVQMALDASGKNIPLNIVTIGIDGELVEKKTS